MSSYIESLLYKYPDLQYEIQQLNQELNSLLTQKNELYSNLRAAAPKETPVQHDISDPTYELIEKIIDKYNISIKDIVERINKRVQTKNFISGRLVLLSQQEYLIIDLRCFQGLQWGTVARRSHYDRSHCFRIYNQALQKISQEIIDIPTAT